MKEFLDTVLTLIGDYDDPCIKQRLELVVGKLLKILSINKNEFKIKTVEPWNSVRLTFNIPKNAALKLGRIASSEAQRMQLQELGILSVHVQGNLSIPICQSYQINPSINHSDTCNILNPNPMAVENLNSINAINSSSLTSGSFYQELNIINESDYAFKNHSELLKIKTLDEFNKVNLSKTDLMPNNSTINNKKCIQVKSNFYNNIHPDLKMQIFKGNISKSELSNNLLDNLNKSFHLANENSENLLKNDDHNGIPLRIPSMSQQPPLDPVLSSPLLVNLLQKNTTPVSPFTGYTHRNNDNMSYQFNQDLINRNLSPYLDKNIYNNNFRIPAVNSESIPTYKSSSMYYGNLNPNIISSVYNGYIPPNFNLNSSSKYIPQHYNLPKSNYTDFLDESGQLIYSLNEFQTIVGKHLMPPSVSSHLMSQDNYSSLKHKNLPPRLNDFKSDKIFPVSLGHHLTDRPSDFIDNRYYNNTGKSPYLKDQNLHFYQHHHQDMEIGKHDNNLYQNSFNQLLPNQRFPPHEYQINNINYNSNGLFNLFQPVNDNFYTKNSPLNIPQVPQVAPPAHQKMNHPFQGNVYHGNGNLSLINLNNNYNNPMYDNKLVHNINNYQYLSRENQGAGNIYRLSTSQDNSIFNQMDKGLTSYDLQQNSYVDRSISLANKFVGGNNYPPHMSESLDQSSYYVKLNNKVAAAGATANNMNLYLEERSDYKRQLSDPTPPYTLTSNENNLFHSSISIHQQNKMSQSPHKNNINNYSSYPTLNYYNEGVPNYYSTAATSNASTTTTKPFTISNSPQNTMPPIVSTKKRKTKAPKNSLGTTSNVCKTNYNHNNTNTSQMCSVIGTNYYQTLSASNAYLGEFYSTNARLNEDITKPVLKSDNLNHQFMSNFPKRDSMISTIPNSILSSESLSNFNDQRNTQYNSQAFSNFSSLPLNPKPSHHYNSSDIPNYPLNDNLLFSQSSKSSMTENVKNVPSHRPGSKGMPGNVGKTTTLLLNQNSNFLSTQEKDINIQNYYSTSTPTNHKGRPVPQTPNAYFCESGGSGSNSQSIETNNNNNNCSGHRYDQNLYGNLGSLSFSTVTAAITTPVSSLTITEIVSLNLAAIKNAMSLKNVKALSNSSTGNNHLITTSITTPLNQISTARCPSNYYINSVSMAVGHYPSNHQIHPNNYTSTNLPPNIAHKNITSNIETLVNQNTHSNMFSPLDNQFKTSTHFSSSSTVNNMFSSLSNMSQLPTGSSQTPTHYDIDPYGNIRNIISNNTMDIITITSPNTNASTSKRKSAQANSNTEKRTKKTSANLNKNSATTLTKSSNNKKTSQGKGVKNQDLLIQINNSSSGAAFNATPSFLLEDISGGTTVSLDHAAYQGESTSQTPFSISTNNNIQDSVAAVAITCKHQQQQQPDHHDNNNNNKYDLSIPQQQLIVGLKGATASLTDLLCNNNNNNNVDGATKSHPYLPFPSSSSSSTSCNVVQKSSTSPSNFNDFNGVNNEMMKMPERFNQLNVFVSEAVPSLDLMDMVDGMLTISTTTTNTNLQQLLPSPLTDAFTSNQHSNFNFLNNTTTNYKVDIARMGHNINNSISMSFADSLLNTIEHPNQPSFLHQSPNLLQNEATFDMRNTCFNQNPTFQHHNSNRHLNMVMDGCTPSVPSYLLNSCYNNHNETTFFNRVIPDSFISHLPNTIVVGGHHLQQLHNTSNVISNGDSLDMITGLGDEDDNYLMNMEDGAGFIESTLFPSSNQTPSNYLSSQQYDNPYPNNPLDYSHHSLPSSTNKTFIKSEKMHNTNYLIQNPSPLSK